MEERTLRLHQALVLVSEWVLGLASGWALVWEWGWECR
jgi:hypothetical protein